MAHDNRPRTYQLASVFLAISGIAHVGGSIVNLFGELTPIMMIIGVLYLVLAYLLQAGRRWIAYIVFPMASFGAVAAYMVYGGTLQIIDLLYLGILAANLGCALVLFYLIWRKKLRTS